VTVTPSDLSIVIPTRPRWEKLGLTLAALEAQTMVTRPPNPPVRVLLACSGLEHAKRGFESFARECFERLREHPQLDMWLIKGSGPDRDRERSVPALKRDDRLARALGRIRGGGLKVEQAAFGLSLQPEILRRKPDVIYFSEWYTGIVLNKLRRVNRQDYALVLSNGSMAPEGFEPFDRVHQHTAPALEYVLARGADPTRQILLPVAFELPDSVPTEDERLTLRDQLGLLRERTIVTSVAALNRWHKRLDYVIAEVARLPEQDRPFLLLVGQPEPETDELRKLGQELLGEDGHRFLTVSRSEVDSLLRASDFFVLGSLAEGLPRALVEAMGHGLPCLAHDYTVTHYAMGPHGLLADLTQDGALAGLLERHAGSGWDRAQAEARRQYVYDNFSWDTLTPQYVEMLAGATGRAPFPT
jgi:1,2-diacylglycerol 3-alpha-glucosyltransferase